jgi:hypothetical protein
MWSSVMPTIVPATLFSTIGGLARFSLTSISRTTSTLVQCSANYTRIFHWLNRQCANPDQQQGSQYL